MTRPVDPYVVRKLADCIELLPRYINNPQKMPFVQEVVQRAFEQNRFDRKASVLGAELLGKPRQAEKYRKPVTSVWLSDSDKDALKDGFEEDETGIFESFEHLAAEIGEWLKECRRPRDAELFRSRLSFVCGEALLHSQGVEVSPNLYRLDLSSWKAEVAKLLCDDLRELADEMATEPSPQPPRDRKDGETKPSWDRIKGELSFDGKTVRRIRRIGVAKNVVAVLDTFQELDWPSRVDSPLPSPNSRKHHATIASLNSGLSRIRFRSDGEGEGFIWVTL